MNQTQENLDAWFICLDDGDTSTNCGFATEGLLSEEIADKRNVNTGLESLVSYAIELQHRYGINSYMGYTPSM